MSVFRFLYCVGGAVRKNAMLCLARLLPMGESLYDIARDAYQAYQENQAVGEIVDDIQQMAQASDEEVAAAAQQVVAEVAAGEPPEVQQRLAEYLAQVPGAVRQSLRRADDPTGRTVPGGFAVRGAGGLVPLLPDHLPRFRPGDTPLPKEPLCLVRLLGVGGFGEVWLAADRAGDLQVVLKFCKDPDSVKVLRHEATLVDRLMRAGRIPGIVPLRRALLEADPACLEYEYIPGGDLAGLLRDFIARATMTPAVAAAWMLSLARTLGFAHRLSPPVVHRDLKPSNILVRRGGPRQVELWVTDFGIGGVSAAEPLPDAQPTVTALRGACTALYASPEQRAGRPPDPRDDVHALGVIWYQLLSGDLTRGRPVGRGWKRQLAEQGVPDEWIDLLEACVDDDPAERPADAAALAARFDPTLVPSLEADGGDEAPAPAVPLVELVRVLDAHRHDWLLNVNRLRDVYVYRTLRRLPGTAGPDGTVTPPEYVTRPLAEGDHARVDRLELNWHAATVNLRVIQPARLVRAADGTPVDEVAGFLLDSLTTYATFTLADSGELHVSALPVRIVRPGLFARLQALGLIPADARFDPRRDVELRLDRLPLVGPLTHEPELLPLFEELAGLRVLSSMVTATLAGAEEDLTPEQADELRRHGLSPKLRYNPSSVSAHPDLEQALADGKVGVRKSFRVELGTTTVLNLQQFRSANDFLGRYYQVTGPGGEAVAKPTFADIARGATARPQTATRKKLTLADDWARPLVDEFLALERPGRLVPLLKAAGANTLAAILQPGEPTPPRESWAYALEEAQYKIEGRRAWLYQEHFSPLAFYVGSTGRLPPTLTAVKMTSAELTDRYPHLRLSRDEKEGDYYELDGAILGVYPRVEYYSVQ